MRIAIIGWGSLIWNPGILETAGQWRSDGPLLPVEFARCSSDGRITLVILEGAQPQRTYWVRSRFADISKARENLALREGILPRYMYHIHGLDAGGHLYGEPPQFVVDSVKEWLKAHARELDAAVWTGLPCNWEKAFGVLFTPQAVVNYLKGLDGEPARRAREYFEKAPKQIRTEVRRLVEETLGWLPEGSSDL